MTLQQGWMAALMACGGWMAQGTAQTLLPITDPDAYAIYGLLLDSQLWPERDDRLLFIVQETRYRPDCRPSKPSPEVWRLVEADLEKQNTGSWKLQAPLPTPGGRVEYRGRFVEVQDDSFPVFSVGTNVVLFLSKGGGGDWMEIVDGPHGRIRQGRTAY